MGAEGFTVDYDGLARLAQRLVDLRGEIEKGTGALDPMLAAVGDEELRHRLDEFATNWADRKGQVVKQLDAAAGFAQQAADVYRQTDEGLRKGFQAPPGAPPPAPAPGPAPSTGGR